MKYFKITAVVTLISCAGVFAIAAANAADTPQNGTRNPLSVHVLDLQTGIPAEGILVSLEKEVNHEWVEISTGTTNGNGRISALYPDNEPAIMAGNYRVTFKTAEYFSTHHQDSIFSEIPVNIHLEKDADDLHIPLLLSRYGYSTYKGS
jgi:5-hydroxyisourate hydrolase